MTDAIVVVVGIFAGFAVIAASALYLQRRVQAKADGAWRAAMEGYQGHALTELQIKSVQERLRLENKAKDGASWFYWIAGLSLLNTLLAILGSSWSFVLGLGVTQIIDAFTRVTAHGASPNLGLTIQIIGFIVDLGFAFVFILCGIFARKKQSWAYLLGMFLYALDGLIFLALAQWVNVGFHLFCLLGLVAGLKAKRKLEAMERNRPLSAVAQ